MTSKDNKKHTPYTAVKNWWGELTDLNKLLWAVVLIVLFAYAPGLVIAFALFLLAAWLYENMDDADTDKHDDDDGPRPA